MEMHRSAVLSGLYGTIMDVIWRSCDDAFHAFAQFSWPDMRLSLDDTRYGLGRTLALSASSLIVTIVMGTPVL